MLKKFVLALLPFAKGTRVSILKPKSIYLPPSTYQNYFSTQKQNPEDNHKKTQSKAENKKHQEKPKAEQNSAQKKLTELSNQQLIELNTEQSLKIVQLNIKKMEELKSKQDQELKQLSKRMEYMDKHHNQAATKQEQLLENIKLQQQELQRIKKRAQKQIQDSKDFAITKLAKQIIDVADSIKRCKIMAEQKSTQLPNDQYLKKMIDLNQQLKEFLKLYDIEEFDPTNLQFDPNTSQGLVTIPTPPGYKKNYVATTMMTGYKIKNRLLRSAKVGIFI